MIRVFTGMLEKKLSPHYIDELALKEPFLRSPNFQEFTILLKSMVQIEDFSKRPSALEVLRELTYKIQKQFQINNEKMKAYLDKEEEYLASSKSDSVTVFLKEDLMRAFKKRKEIYQAAYPQSKRTLDILKEYCQNEYPLEEKVYTIDYINNSPETSSFPESQIMDGLRKFKSTGDIDVKKVIRDPKASFVVLDRDESESEEVMDPKSLLNNLKMKFKKEIEEK